MISQLRQELRPLKQQFKDAGDEVRGQRPSFHDEKEPFQHLEDRISQEVSKKETQKRNCNAPFMGS